MSKEDLRKEAKLEWTRKERAQRGGRKGSPDRGTQERSPDRGTGSTCYGFEGAGAVWPGRLVGRLLEAFREAVFIRVEEKTGWKSSGTN